MAKFRESKIKAILNSCVSDAGISKKNPELLDFSSKIEDQLLKIESCVNNGGEQHEIDEYFNTIIHIASSAKKFNKYFY